MLVQAFVYRCEMDWNVGMRLMQPCDSFWRANQTNKLDFRNAPLFEDVHCRHCRATGREHWVENQARADSVHT